jgi:hypothetical protein
MQVDEALSRLAGRFASAPINSGARKKRAAGSKTAAAEDDGAVISPKAKRAKTPAAAVAAAVTPVKQEAKPKTKTKKNVPFQEQVRAEPAACKENQALVDQFMELGEFELLSGYTQRGTARLRAAKQLRDSPFPITSGAQAKQLDHVGRSSAAKIDDILRGGLDGALREYSDKK